MYKYVYLDFDIDDERAKLARGAAFVHYTSLRYGFSSNDIRLLGGSELPRITDFYVGDHEWKDKGEIVVKRQTQGRLILRLFVDKAPLACENFLRLCIGKEKDPMLKYKGTKIHRIISGFVMQGGDMQFGNGSGGMSVWGKPFKDEKGGLSAKHDRRGVLSMGNSGKNSNTSQFFITFDKAPPCDGKHVVFGEVVSGFDVLEAIESAEKQKRDTKAKDVDDALSSVVITECGEYVPHKIPGAGYWLDFPNPDAYGGFTPVFMFWPRVCIVSPSQNVEEKFVQVLSKCCSIVAKNRIGSKEAAAEMVKSNSIDILVVAGVCKDLAPTFGEEEAQFNNMVVVTIPLNAKEDVFASW
eukprot:CAMPEP_0204831916 /NCGR_PEP_ID=MMETSP1346-20131115/12100_1 /ASSEMBLY_ACC=CAM_ASM_000771 /TAXON_ID=215587 /ORGANISM="Aplanochytrium stocchinoi, Strain GSBS06" /LENGTH=353 /DNA_ID=CAMNT_0051963355 /DNA_START=108 /DNA_END=1166 /DNA_ORIENTATION=+